MRTTTIHVAIAAAIATVATFCAMAAETGNGLGQKTGEPQSGLRHLKVCRANGGGQPVVDAAPPATNGAFRIMSYNVRFGKGMDGVRDYRRTARCILSEGPDYVCVQEIWNWKEFRRLAGYLGMHGTFANSRHFLGNAVFSREKPIKCEAVELPYSKKLGRTLVICEYKDFVVASMHFDLDVNKRKESVRVVQKALEKYSKPVFIAGDWNNFPKSPVLKGLKKFVKVVSPEKNVHTYHLRTMKRKEAVIDYIAIDKTHAKDFSVLRSYEVPDRKTSDHSPIVVELKPAEGCDFISLGATGSDLIATVNYHSSGSL